MMKVVAIAAVGKNGVIGKDSDLPWNIPEDMSFFRESTKNHVVIMGRKTYQALGKALPKRENAIITRDQNFKVSDARVFHDLKAAIDFYQSREELSGKILFVIGGAEIYSLSLPFLDEIWLTEIDFEFEGNVFFPHYRNGHFNVSEFSKTTENLQKDYTATPFKYVFSVFSRSKKHQ